MEACITKAGVFYHRAHAEASSGSMAKEETNHTFRGHRRVLHEGMTWRHSHAVRSRWQRSFRDLRQVEPGRCCDCAMQTLWF